VGLMITRRAGESVIIGDDITVTVVATEDRSVKLRFTAPKTIRIDRQEVRRRILNGEVWGKMLKYKAKRKEEEK
jgi:carbon storage regulator